MTAEYSGASGRSGLPKKPTDALTASEKLRLGYTTGTADADAPLNSRAWTGETLEIDPKIKKLIDEQ